MMNIIRKISIDDSLYLFILFGLLGGYIREIVILFIIVIIHELGHVIFFRLFNIEIDKIVIYPSGGMCYVNKKINNRILYDVMINIGGILMQVLLFIIVNYLWKNGFIVDSTYKMFNMYNAGIILFNLLPIIPLDGSKLLLNVFCKIFSFRNSYLLMIIVSVICLILFIIFNIFIGINSLVIVVFLLYQVILIIKNYKYIMNKFYLERIIYDNYFNEIISDKNSIKDMKLDKYYYFYNNGRYYSEKEWLRNNKIL